MIGYDPVYLLGHAPVERSQASLHMADLDVKLRRGESSGEHRVGIALHIDDAGLFLHQNILDAGEHLTCLMTVAPEPTSK